MDTGPAAIGRYQVRARLGQGGMGVLYLALDPAIDRLIALKLLRVDDDALRERFLREARLAARLQHPNIVTIYDVGSHEGQPFIAMEYIAGETLAELIQRRAALTPLRKLELMLDACQGLAYAHKNGIVHRDIKPANLMVNRESEVLKVLDFGIARGAQSNLTQIGMLIGTPNYMAPEQVEGKPVDQRADVFALGLVLYELLVYRQAFKADTPHAVLHQVLNVTPTPVHVLEPALDPALAGIIDKAIAKDPAARYADLERLRLDLVRIVQRLKVEQDNETVILADHEGETKLTGGVIVTRAIEAERDAREIAAWMQKARALFEAGSLTQAGQAVMEALQIDRQHIGAQALRAEIDRAFDERDRHRERSQAVARALTRVDESMRAGALDTALRATGEALGYDPGNADALARRAQVLALVDRQASVAIAEAREHMAAGRRDQALQRLQSFSPWHEGVEAALVALRQELGLPTQGLSGTGARSGIARPAPAGGGTVPGWTPHPASGVGTPGAGAGASSVGAPGATSGAPSGVHTSGTFTSGQTVGGTVARAHNRLAYVAAGVVVLIAFVSVFGWMWVRKPQPQNPQSQNAAVERPAEPSGGGTPSTGNAASGTAKPSGAAADPASAAKTPSGATSTATPSGGRGSTSTPTPPGAGAGSGAGQPLPEPPPPPGAPGAPPLPASVPSPDAGAPPATDPSGQSIEATMTDLQRVLGRRDRRGLDSLTRVFQKLPITPKMHQMMRQAVVAAERDADSAREAAVRAQPNVRASSEFQDALAELRRADQLKRNNRPAEALRRFWNAQDQFEALGSRTPPTSTASNTTTPGTSSVPSAAGGTSTPPAAAPPAPEPPKPEAPRPAEPAASTAKPTPTPAPTTQPPPSTAENRPAENRPPATGDSRTAIQQTLNRYATAYSSLQGAQVATVWVTMTADQVGRLNQAFGNVDQYTVTLSGCSINETGASARATCARQIDIRFKNGTRRSGPPDRPTFTLEKRGSDWVIVHVKVS